MSQYILPGPARETLESMTNGLHLNVLPVGSDLYVSVAYRAYRRYIRLDENRIETYIVGSRRSEIILSPLKTE